LVGKNQVVGEEDGMKKESKNGGRGKTKKFRDERHVI
jgi:hypothetical protein